MASTDTAAARPVMRGAGGWDYFELGGASSSCIARANAGPGPGPGPAGYAGSANKILGLIDQRRR